MRAFCSPRFQWALRVAIACTFSILFSTVIYPDPALPAYLVLAIILATLSPTFGITLKNSVGCGIGVLVSSCINIMLFRLFGSSKLVSGLSIFVVSIWFAGCRLPPLGKKVSVAMSGLTALRLSALDADTQASMETTTLSFPWTILVATIIACAISLGALLLPLPKPGFARTSLQLNLKRGRCSVSARFKALLHVFFQQQLHRPRRTKAFLGARLQRLGSAPLAEDKQEEESINVMEVALESTGIARNSQRLSLSPWMLRLRRLKSELAENIVSAEKYLSEIAWEPGSVGESKRFAEQLEELKELRQSTDGMEILIEQQDYFKKVKPELLREIEAPLVKIGELCEKILLLDFSNGHSRIDSGSADDLATALSDFNQKLFIGRGIVFQSKFEINIAAFEGSIASNFFFLNVVAFVDTLQMNHWALEGHPAPLRHSCLSFLALVLGLVKDTILSLSFPFNDLRSLRIRRSLKVGCSMIVAALPGGLIWNRPFGYWAAVTVGFLAGSGQVQGGFLSLSLERLTGTTLGAIFGHFVILILSGHREVGYTLLVLWCFVWGYLRSTPSLSYIALVSAFTSGIIILSEPSSGATAAEISFSRIEQTFIGVVVVVLFDTFFFPERASLQVFDYAMKAMRRGHGALGRVWLFFATDTDTLSEKQRECIASHLTEFGSALREAKTQIPNAVVEPNLGGKAFEARTFEELIASLHHIHVWVNTLSVLINRTHQFSPVFASKIWVKMRSPLKQLCSAIFQTYATTESLLAATYPNSRHTKKVFAKIARESRGGRGRDAAVAAADESEEMLMNAESQMDQNTINTLHDIPFMVQSFSNKVHEMHEMEKFADLEFLSRLEKFIKRVQGDTLLFSNRDLAMFYSIMFSLHALARELETAGSSLAMHLQSESLSSPGLIGDLFAQQAGERVDTSQI